MHGWSRKVDCSVVREEQLFVCLCIYLNNERRNVYVCMSAVWVSAIRFEDARFAKQLPSIKINTLLQPRKRILVRYKRQLIV